MRLESHEERIERAFPGTVKNKVSFLLNLMKRELKEHRARPQEGGPDGPENLMKRELKALKGEACRSSMRELESHEERIESLN